jgi:hypothetical protein
LAPPDTGDPDYKPRYLRGRQAKSNFRRRCNGTLRSGRKGNEVERIASVEKKREVTVNWKEQWKLLSTRIHGGIEAGKFLFTADSKGQISSVPYQEMQSNVGDMFQDLRSFWGTHQSALPVGAELRLNKFVQKYSEYFAKVDFAAPEIATRLMLLAAIQVELDYLFADREAAVKSSVNRAFSHLRRSIVADPSTQKIWQEAFERGEVQCEKLGDSAPVVRHICFQG